MAKLVRAHIVRRRQTRRQQLRAEMERMVRERVDEILAQRDGEMLDGEFSSMAVSTEITRRTMLFDRRKWALYFARWGCRGCRTKKRSHDGQGYCQTCYERIAQRLKALKRDWDREHPQHPPELDAVDEKIRAAKRVFASETAPTEEE